MKNRWLSKVIAFVLAGAMTVCLASAAAPTVKVYAEETEGGSENTGKYVSDVFIAYGKTEDKAKEWLEENGWEPVKGDFNAGKASFWDDNKLAKDNVAAVMGIKRTDNEKAAITDLAVMNMTGGYSVPAYEELVKEKKAEIDECVNSLLPMLEEYRANYNGQGSSYGKLRAKLAYRLLNKYYDGNPEGEYAVNDTGQPLGKLLLEKTRQEGNESGADMQQMLLEGNGSSMLAVEAILVLATDTGKKTWLERSADLTGPELSENLAQYAPEAAGRDVVDSEVPQYLNEKYGDTAALMEEQWGDVHDDILWYEQYNDEHDLWQGEDESDEEYTDRLNEAFADLETTEDSEYVNEADRYNKTMLLYDKMYDIPYQGDWGETMGDFFNPAEEEWCYPESDYFLPMAAAMSNGQRAGFGYMSFGTMLATGTGTEEGLKSVEGEITSVFGEKTEFDIYEGVNREAFRGGVALTNEALMEQNAGKGQAFEEMYNNVSNMAMTSYALAAVGAVTLGAGIYMTVKGVKYLNRGTASAIRVAKFNVRTAKIDLDLAKDMVKKGEELWMEGTDVVTVEKLTEDYNKAQANLKAAQGTKVSTTMGVTGRVFMAVGGALLIAAAIVSAVRLAAYYDRDMLPIPRMIVHESDIVTYLTDKQGNPLLDEKGNQKKNIDFNTYEYYSAVKCNRPDVGEIGDWNDGVSDYKDPEHFCYDIADLNCDMGQEWIGLYYVKSKNKGYPLLADSLKLRYGKQDMPKGCTKALHLFTYTNAVDLGDTAWAYNNDKKGVYFFWDEDTTAFATKTASVFGAGQLALAGIGGLILGLLGATAVWLPKRRKEKVVAAQNETTAV